MRYLILLILLSSCVTEKQRAKICQGCPVKIERHDSVIERLVEVEIPLYISGPKVYLENPCSNLCDSLGRLKDFEIDKTENGIKTAVRGSSDSNKIEISSELKDTVSTSVKVHDTKTTEIRDVPVCNLEHLTRWDRFCRWFTFAGLAMITGAVLWKFRKVFI